MMRVNLQPILKYGIEIVSNTIMQGYPFDSHMDGWVANERADCKPINSLIANLWVKAETH